MLHTGETTTTRTVERMKEYGPAGVVVRGERFFGVGTAKDKKPGGGARRRRLRMIAEKPFTDGLVSMMTSGLDTVSLIILSSDLSREELDERLDIFESIAKVNETPSR